VPEELLKEMRGDDFSNFEARITDMMSLN